MQAESKPKVAAMALVALGVVYGDIGTSPLYALREVFHHGLVPTESHVLGVLSLITWALIFIITVKYLLVLLNANNRGEGGILTLMSLTRRQVNQRRSKKAIVIAGLCGAALLYGDGMITPAISVLSAVEGISIANPKLTALVIPLTCIILTLLFVAQKKGSEKIGKLFGPITLIWFTTLALLGLRQIIHHPEIFQALNPLLGLQLLWEAKALSLLILGSVFLVVTGGEALYADMGHFNKRAIRLSWFTIVLPGLLLNYYGQGALIIQNPQYANNPFYALAPEWALYPLIILATAATIIAAQAVITGVFSLTRQAVRLGYAPRTEIIHTSKKEGQIYLPTVNWLLLIACIILVISFKSSSNLASAYGLAVALDMFITAALLAVWLYHKFPKHRLITMTGLTIVGIIDATFLLANIIKIPQGGWVPLVVGTALFLLMTTWYKGRRLVDKALAHEHISLASYLSEVHEQNYETTEGTAVYMNKNPNTPPQAMLRNLQANHIRHERMILLTVITEEVPQILNRKHVEVEDLGNNVWRVIARYGYHGDPHVERILRLCKHEGVEINPEEVTYFVGQERVISTEKDSGMAKWREKLFAFMLTNNQQAATYFHLPAEKVVEVGVQVDI